MNETWWVSPSQLDDQQTEILSALPEDQMLIVGPPGSGKTNILMLRANYVKSVAPRILLLTFTRTLAEFLRSGPNVGRSDQIQQNDIKTFMQWARRLIQELGGEIPDNTGNFNSDRLAISDYLLEILRSEKTGKLYDVVFIDEVQDFIRSELECIRLVSHKMNAAGDSRQRIWKHREGLPTVALMTGKTVQLIKHYRIGERICEYADQILPPKADETALIDGCNYPEEDRPSSVKPVLAYSRDALFEICLDTIKEQLRYIIDEPIGVLCSSNDIRDGFWDYLEADGELESLSIIQRATEYQSFGPRSQIRVMTVASAKGSEFRAIHLLDGEQYGTHRRELAFTAVTRAKTEVAIYHINPLPSHMNPPLGELPNLTSIF